MLELAVISRHVLAKRLHVRPQTIAKREKSWFPSPIERISDRLILYAVKDVEEAFAARTSRILRKVVSRR